MKNSINLNCNKKSRFGFIFGFILWFLLLCFFSSASFSGNNNNNRLPFIANYANSFIFKTPLLILSLRMRKRELLIARMELNRLRTQLNLSPNMFWIRARVNISMFMIFRADSTLTF
ncbi:hypothetical protein CsSME_00020193 [Camellia sinensis var. sinensis]